MGIDKTLCSVQYASFDDAIRIVQKAGKGSLICKRDIQGSFSNLCIRPSDFRLTGFKFDGFLVFQKVLPMGCAISPKAFESFSTFIEWRVKRESGLCSISHYVDDFICVGRYGT